MALIVLNAGHGGNLASKRGFYGNGYENNEGVNNYLTCKLMKEYLESKYICEVKLTRPKVEDYPSLSSRGAMFPNCDLYYGRHSNAFSDKSVRGTEMWVGTGSREASQLSVELCKNLSALFKHNNRGLKKGDAYVEIKAAKANGAKMAIMAEVGFHTNPIDSDILVNNRIAVAELEAETIAKFMKLETIPVEEKEVLDEVQQWAVNNKLVSDSAWEGPINKKTLVWILFTFWRKLSAGALK